MALNGKAPIGVELVKKGVVTEADIEAAIEYQKEHPNKKIGDILNILNLCPQRDLIKAMGEILGEKVIVLRPDSINVNVTDYISLDICKSCKAMLFDIMGGKAKVCFADTANKRYFELSIAIIIFSSNSSPLSIPSISNQQSNEGIRFFIASIKQQTSSKSFLE